MRIQPVSITSTKVLVSHSRGKRTICPDVWVQTSFTATREPGSAGGVGEYAAAAEGCVGCNRAFGEDGEALPALEPKLSLLD